MDKTQEYEELEEEIRNELSSIDEMLEETSTRCIKVSNDEVCASMTFKVPAFIYPENTKEIKDKLLRLKQLSKDLDLLELNDDEINSAIEALDTLESSYEKEFEKPEEIDDLRCGLDMNLAEPPILSSNDESLIAVKRNRGAEQQVKRKYKAKIISTKRR